ncbi:MAG TPA: hypothetical protein DC040_05865 [Deltaproteobacteria bacterium]|nr:hypothetical protein [Deltaproteobacteria bacterium]
MVTPCRFESGPRHQIIYDLKPKKPFADNLVNGFFVFLLRRSKSKFNCVLTLLQETAPKMFIFFMQMIIFHTSIIL